jgi:hypothetical protein
LEEKIRIVLTDLVLSFYVNNIRDVKVICGASAAISFSEHQVAPRSQGALKA